MRLSDLRAHETSQRRQTKYCDVEGCNAATREGKPYCPDHIEMSPYVRGVVGALLQREREDEAVLRAAHPERVCNFDGITVQGIIQQLAVHGTRSRERLCRELSMDRELLDKYAEALIKRRLVIGGRSDRRRETLTLRKRKRKS